MSPRPLRLVPRNALRPLPVLRRFLLVSDEVADVFDGHMNAQGFPGQGDIVVSNYLSGMTVNVSVARKKRSRKDPLIDLEKIDGVDEIWALCVRRPRPGWRFFGRFLERDVLILLSAYDKQVRGESYVDESERVLKLWDRVLPGAQALHGDRIYDYVSGPFYDVDEKHFHL